MRAFLACCIDGDCAALASALAGHADRYRSDGYRWIPAANYHVTLRFLGELTQLQVDRVVESVRGVADDVASIACRALSLQPLPSPQRPSVIALPIDSAGRLESLAAELNAVLENDFGPPDHPFRAHLSVVRCRRGARFLGANSTLDFPLTMGGVTLFESRRSNSGSRYVPLWTFRRTEV